MSVFTTLTSEEAKTLLQDYAIGSFVELKGISAGVTNTNYFLITNKARYVLTIFEQNSMDELPYFVDLTAHLAEQGISCPIPIADKQGNSLRLIKGKPALVISCLQGQTLEIPSTDQCAQVGHELAKMHLVGASFKQVSKNQRGEDWRKETVAKVIDKVSEKDRELLNLALGFQTSIDLSTLPQGVIHGDLFRDNVLFDGPTLGGFIDFYYACDDVLAYDVAITVNDWCVTVTGEFHKQRLDAFMQAYSEVRPFNVVEQQAWQGLLCIAALRFWLSRLNDWHFPQTGEITHAKDPDYFKQVLLKRAMLT